MDVPSFGAGVFAGLSIWFWVLLFIEAGLGIFLVRSGYGLIGALSIIAFFLVAHFLTGFDVVAFVTLYWHWIILWFFPVGVFVSFLKWDRYVKRTLADVQKDISCAMKEASHELRTTRWEDQEETTRVAGKITLPDDVRKDPERIEAMASDLDKGVTPECLVTHIRRTLHYHPDLINWKENKSRIASWVIFWPFALIGYFFDDLLDVIIGFFGKAYTKIEKRNISNSNIDVRFIESEVK